jgi:hypothetical protein
VKIEESEANGRSPGTDVEDGQASGEGVEGVRIRIRSGDRSYVAVTDEGGRFRFDRLRPGKWEVRINTNDLPSLLYVDKEIFEVEAGPGEDKKITFRAFQKEREIQELELGDEELELGEEE